MGQEVAQGEVVSPSRKLLNKTKAKFGGYKGETTCQSSRGISEGEDMMKTMLRKEEDGPYGRLGMMWSSTTKIMASPSVVIH